MPLFFDSVMHAYDTLDGIILFMHNFFKPITTNQRSLPYSKLRSNHSFNLEEITNLLQKWKDIFRVYTNKHVSWTKSEEVTRNVLRIQHFAASIQIATFFYNDQLAYDAYISDFTQIIDLGSKIVQDPAFSTEWGKFSVDIGVVQPLYYVACRCRHPILRRRAISLLYRAGREGVWDGEAMSAVASWVMEREEREEPVTESKERDNFIPEERRLREIGISIDRNGRSIRMVSTRRREEGLEYVTGQITALKEGGFPKQEDPIEDDDEGLKFLVEDWKRFTEGPHQPDTSAGRRISIIPKELIRIRKI